MSDSDESLDGIVALAASNAARFLAAVEDVSMVAPALAEPIDHRKKPGENSTTQGPTNPSRTITLDPTPCSAKSLAFTSASPE